MRKKTKSVAEIIYTLVHRMKVFFYVSFDCDIWRVLLRLFSENKINILLNIVKVKSQ